MIANRPRECWIVEPDDGERLSGRLAESLQTEEHSGAELATICDGFLSARTVMLD